MKTVATMCHRKEPAPVKVALAYEDDAAFRAAMGIYRGVAGALTAQFEFRDFWWRFGALAKPGLFERAVGIAAEAGMVFCCPSNPHVLPGLVQDWIRQWLTRRTQPDGALVVLLPVVAGNSRSPTLLERDLRETARAGALIFSQRIIWLITPNLRHRVRTSRPRFLEKTWMSSAWLNTASECITGELTSDADFAHGGR